VWERGTPDEFHSAIQTFFAAYFGRLKRELHVRVRPELRLRVSARRYRIPDVMLLPATAPFQAIPDTAPVLCIEVLSPDDRAGALQEKLDDYVAMGVGAIWIVDPHRRRLSTADANGTQRVDSFRVPGSEYVISADEIFAELDAPQ